MDEQAAVLTAAEHVARDWRAWCSMYPLDDCRLDTQLPSGPAVGWQSLRDLSAACERLAARRACAKPS